MISGRRRKWKYAVLMLLIVLVAFFLASNRVYQIQFDGERFIESAKEVPGADRGFYRQCGYVISRTPQDFSEAFLETEEGEEFLLEMLQINLQNFSDGDITDVGIANIENLFQNLSQKNCRWIVRILYDWSNKAEEYEPKNLGIILRHMQQIGPILQKYANCIFTLQGLFIGNWGEMNGTPFVDQESLQRLAEELVRSTKGELYLSVRMPMYWRRITGIGELSSAAVENNPAAARIGLYNDGMLGNASDWGTYGSGESRRNNPLTYWNRSEELEFQDELCKYVPNGGEAICDNPYNDFPIAVQTLKTMHVTYLNRDYDKTVQNKWAEYIVEEDGCFQGMDGLTYICRHLGYRYLLDSVSLEYSYWKNQFVVSAAVKNVGFAPVYFEKPMTLFLCDGEECIPIQTQGDLRKLTGGNQSEDVLWVTGTISAAALKGREYEAYLQIWDPVTNSPMVLANEQEPEELGYYLGRIQFARVSWYDRVRSGMTFLGLK